MIQFTNWKLQGWKKVVGLQYYFHTRSMKRMDEYECLDKPDEYFDTHSLSIVFTMLKAREDDVKKCWKKKRKKEHSMVVILHLY